MKIYPSQLVVVSGASGGGTDQYVAVGEWVGPASYPTGGFTIDLSSTYALLRSLSLVVKTRGANLPLARCEYLLNSPSAGIATVKLMRKRYNDVTFIGDIAAGSQPAGVTIRTASGGTSSSESSHTHAIDHDHGSFTSGVNTTGGGATLLNAVGPNLAQHTHTLDLPSFTGTSGAGTAHNHTDNSLYAHAHSVAHSAMNLIAAELANATNLSGTTWLIMATGEKA